MDSMSVWHVPDETPAAGPPTVLADGPDPCGGGWWRH